MNYQVFFYISTLSLRVYSGFMTEHRYPELLRIRAYKEMTGFLSFFQFIGSSHAFQLFLLRFRAIERSHVQNPVPANALYLAVGLHLSTERD